MSRPRGVAGASAVSALSAVSAVSVLGCLRGGAWSPGTTWLPASFPLLAVCAPTAFNASSGSGDGGVRRCTGLGGGGGGAAARIAARSLRSASRLRSLSRFGRRGSEPSEIRATPHGSSANYNYAGTACQPELMHGRKRTRVASEPSRVAARGWLPALTAAL